jgi:hypothetical protein
VSPIYVRPAREQSEHDRLIRHLQAKYKKKFDVAANIDGVEPVTFVKIGPATLTPDLVLTEGKKLAGLVEVETGESVNNLEAMAQWVHFSHARVPFHLYVPVHGYEAARRLCDSYQARVGEIWTYRPTHDGFDLVRLHNDPAAAGATRGAKAVPVSIFIPPPKPVAVPEVVEAPKPAAVPARAAGGARPVPPKAGSKAVPAAVKAEAKPAAKPAPAVPPSAPKPAAKPAAKPSKEAKPAHPAKPVKAEKPATRPVKAAKVAKPAKPAKSVKAAKARPAAKPAAKTRKAAPARGRKPAARKSR